MQPALLLLALAAHRPFADLPAVPVPPLDTHLTAEQVTQKCEQIEQQADQKLAALVAVPDDKRTFANSFDALEQTVADYGDAALRLGFLKDIHTDAKVRAAAAGCEERTGKYLVKIGARVDLFKAMRAYLSHPAGTDQLDVQDKRLIELTMRDFRRNGLELPDADRAKLVDLRSKLAELSTKFAHNLDENTDAITATESELAGLPAAYIARLKKTPDGKRYIVTTKYPDYYPLMENARSEAVRRRMEEAFDERALKENTPILAEAIALRDRAAHLLGFKTHADFVTEDRMAQSARAVSDFLGRLRTELKPGRDALDARMLQLKRKETRNARAQLELWDWRYYLNEIKQKDYAVDDERVRAWFPADKVLNGMFAVYAELFHVVFKEVPNADVWAPGVKLFEIHEAPDGKLLAEFYVDMFPRQGKYGHAASFNLGVSREIPAGYQIPLGALVVNFDPPQNGKSAHLNIQEVEVLFHEFGHIMHGSLTTARYNSQAGTNVATDFVEAPSQMLENWVYQPEVLQKISADPNDPSKPMPEELAKKLVAARTFDAGVRYTRQVYLATLDLELHTSGEKVDPDAVERKVRGDVMGYPMFPKEHSVASFGHLMGGYDAGYYGYLWSQVFAEDMFTRFQSEGVLNPSTGRAYRNTILAKGRTVEPDVLLKEFLGRAPDEHAFLRLMGIEKS